MMANLSKRKGTRLENRVVKEFRKAGIPTKRVPLSGSAKGFEGDVILEGDLRLECKSRKDDFKRIYNWLEGNFGVVLKADRREILIVIRLNDFVKLLKSE